MMKRIAAMPSALVSVLLMAASFPSGACGEDLSIGLGFGISPEYPGADEFQIFPLLSFNYETDRFSVESDGLGLALDVIPDKAIGVGPLVRYSFGRSSVEDRIVRRLADVDDAVEVGAFASYTLPVAALGFDDPAVVSARIRLAQDVADGHGGLVGDLSLSAIRAVSKDVTLIAGVSADWASDDYMRAFFGVSPADARNSGLRRFDAGGGVSQVSFTLGASWQATESLSLSLIGSVGQLIGDAADSPITKDRGDTTQGFVGLTLSWTVF